MKYRIRHFFELLYLLVQKELTVRYKSSILGYLWALANPFAFALVYYVAFKLIMRVQMHNYSVFLLTGMFPWAWLANSLTQATGSYRKNASLVKKVNLDRAVLPMGNVAHEMVHFCFAIPILALFIYIANVPIFASWIWQLPMMILLQLAMVYPVALMLALANVYVHDVEYLVGIGLSMLFFLNPIVYPGSMIPEAYRHYFEWSPLAALIDNWRSIFLDGQINLHMFGYCVIVALITGVLSYVAYRKTAGKLGELL